MATTKWSMLRLTSASKKDPRDNLGLCLVFFAFSPHKCRRSLTGTPNEASCECMAPAVRYAGQGQSAVRGSAVPHISIKSSLTVFCVTSTGKNWATFTKHANVARPFPSAPQIYKPFTTRRL